VSDETKRVTWTLPRWVYDRVVVQTRIEQRRSVQDMAARLLVMALKSLEHKEGGQ
jgi:hypothetical protein